MADDERHLLAIHLSLHHEEATSEMGGVATHGISLGLNRTVSVDVEAKQRIVDVARRTIIEGHEHATLQLEETGIVEEGAFNTSTVRTGIIHVFPTALLKGGLLEQVLKGVMVLHFGQSNHSGTVGQFVRTEFGKHTGHVVELGLILHLAPLVLTIGQVLIIVLAGVVERVEEVFKIVERHAIHLIALLFLPMGRERTECRHADEQKDKGKDKSFHIEILVDDLFGWGEYRARCLIFGFRPQISQKKLTFPTILPTSHEHFAEM